MKTKTMAQMNVAERRAMGLWWLAVLAAMLGLVLLATGCRMTGGSAGSYHRTERWQVTPEGKAYLAERETIKDRNNLKSGGMLASANATAVDTTRSNFMGSVSRTSVGKYSDKPEAAAITAAGTAVGGVISEAVKGTVKP